MNRIAAIILLAGVAVRAASPGAQPAELARQYCQACHVFPEPALLDRQTWINGALRRMAPLLGAAKIDLDRKADGQILKAANVFPSVPLISEEDWRAIMKFYYESAPERPLPQKTQPPIGMALDHFRPRPLRYPGSSTIVSLMRIDAGRRRIFVGNAGARSLDTITPRGEVVSRVSLESAPVDLTVRPEGLYVTLIGDLYPSDERKGKLVLVSETNGMARVTTLLDHLARPASTVLGDFNGDGREDLFLCSFGNYLGKVAWYERSAAGALVEHPLLEQPGAVNAVRHGAREIYLLTAQAREGIHRFTTGAEPFKHEVLAEFHPAFGSSHLEIVDFNKDGFPDLLVTNGDNGDYPSQPKNYHGVRLYLNDGKGSFHEDWFYALNGAFKAMAADFDLDGDLDIAAISFFPDYPRKPEESFVLFQNDGALMPQSFPGASAGRWLTMDAGDLDGDGDADIVLGSFSEGPVSVPIPAELRAAWRTNAPILWLENTTHAP